MNQPQGILTAFTTTYDQAIKGWFINHKPYRYPVLANYQQLLPFQARRTAPGDAVTVFKLVGQGTEIDLIADVAKIDIYEYEDLEWLIYMPQTLITTLPTYGCYYIHIEDGTNTWYFDYMQLGAFTLSSYSFGAYQDYYTNAYERETTTIGENSNYYEMLLTRTNDMTDKIYQNNYYDQLILKKGEVSHRYLGRSIQSEIDESTGKSIVNQIFSFDEYELTFIVNRNIANFLNKIKQLDKITVILPNSETIDSYEFESNISDLESDQIKKVNIKYRINFIDKSDTTYDYETSDIVGELG